MGKFRKVLNNLVSRNAVAVLGPAKYATYVAKSLGSIPSVIRAGDLRPVDKVMGASVNRFRYRGNPFYFDCRFCDEHLKENSFGFGGVRELYIRDCYFKWQPRRVYEQAKMVVDIGANRGAFSSLMTTKAQFILCVECQEHYAPIIRHNMQLNDFKNYAVETAFIGEGGESADSEAPRITLEELFDRHRIEAVDFLKMDVEGSEFELLKSADWLQRVRALSMEVHQKFGNPSHMTDCFAQHGFAQVVADENLQRLTDARHASFIYAWKDV